MPYMQLAQSHSARYDLLAVNLTVAVITAVLLAAVGSSVKVVQLLEAAEVAGIEIDLAVGVAVNPGVLTAGVAIFFAMMAAVLCTAHNRLMNHELIGRMVSVISWIATGITLVFFTATLILTSLTLAAQVGL